MQKLFASIVCFSLCAVMATAQGGKGKGGLKVEGSWTATSAIANGKKIPDDVIAKVMMVVTFKEGKYSLTSAGLEETGTYTIDAKKKPAQIDLVQTSKGKDKGKLQLGLIKIDGDVMTLVFSKAGSKDRPKDFEAGEAYEVTVLKRGK
jgi:uncharacterized protein (TIGR03067 family)